MRLSCLTVSSLVRHAKIALNLKMIFITPDGKFPFRKVKGQEFLNFFRRSLINFAAFIRVNLFQSRHYL